MDQNQDITELVQRIKKNDILAMKVVYNQYVSDMLTVSYRITNNMQDAEEVIQNAFMGSFDKIGQLKDPNKYYSWLKRSVINRSLTLTKSNNRYTELNEEVIGESEEPKDHNWFGQVSMAKIKEAIQKLPDGCRQVLTLFLFENYKHREIASKLGIAESTSKSQYQYALKILRSDLSKYYV